MTNEERILSLHQKMNKRRVMKERRVNRALGAGSLALFGIVIAVISREQVLYGGTSAGTYTGSTFVFQNAGSYVLLALAAFMLGVVITVLCIRMRKHNQEEGKEE